jgi:hypothetical protein
MSSPPSPVPTAGTGLRLLRAAVFAAVCVALSAAGHVLVSCDTLPMWSLALALLAGFGLAVPLAGRRRSLAGIATTLGAWQVVLHTLFGYGQLLAERRATAAANTSSVVEQATRLLCGNRAAPLSASDAYRVITSAGLHPHTSVDGIGGLDLLPSLPSLPMLLGHLLVALATGWLLRSGDLALFRLTELSARQAQGVAEAALVRALRDALALVRALRAGLPAPTAGRRPPYPRHFGAGRPTAVALQHTVIRRGPPTGPLALAA